MRDALEAEDVAHGRGGGEGLATPVEGRESVASDGSHRRIEFLITAGLRLELEFCLPDIVFFLDFTRFTICSSRRSCLAAIVKYRGYQKW